MAIELIAEKGIDAAFQINAESVALDRKTGNLHNLSLSLCACGNIYRLKGDWEEAEKCITEALQIAQKSNIAPAIAMCLGTLAFLFYDMEQYAKARDLSRKGVSTMTKILLRNAQASLMYGPLVWSSIEMGELEEAERSIINLQAAAQEQKVDQASIDRISDMKAMLQRAQKKWDESIEYFEKRIQEFESGTFPRLVHQSNYYFPQHVLIECARAYLERNRKATNRELSPP